MTSIFSGVNATSSASQTSTDSKVGLGMAGMDSTDFLKLLTAQLQMQDPTAPVDNKDMLAQMAQFTSLSTNTEMNSTLKAIALKLGAITDTTSTTGSTSTTTDTTATDTTATDTATTGVTA